MAVITKVCGSPAWAAAPPCTRPSTSAPDDDDWSLPTSTPRKPGTPMMTDWVRCPDWICFTIGLIFEAGIT